MPRVDRGQVALWLAGLGFGVTALSQANVQLFSSAKTLEAAEQSKRYEVGRTDFAARGNIYSADGQLLAQNADTFELGIQFAKVPHSPGFFSALAAAAGISVSELQSAADAGRKSLSFRRELSIESARQVEAVKASWRADGVSLHRTQKRDYALGAAAAGIVGRMVEGRAVTGLELSQNQNLAGENGFQKGLVDRTGAFLPMRMAGESKPRRNGETIRLTIHSARREAGSQSVRAAVERNKADSGVAVVLDPKTGNILAMAQWPAYEEGMKAEVARQADFNPAIMGTYEPGSTFKILTLAEAIDHGKCNPGQHLYCGGTLQINSAWRIRCDEHHGTRAHGSVDAEVAIAKSCNVSAATWALRIGYPEMVKFLEQLGLLEKTGLGLPGERAGLFNRNEYAKPLQIANVGFGQAISCTPVALASAFATLANDGVRLSPRLIDSVGRQIQPPATATTILKPESAHTVMKLMEAVIQSDAGTGKGLRVPGYRLAGKTGTAQKIGGEKSGGHVSSFVGYVPSTNTEAVILVMIDNPKGGQFYGSQVAGPVFLDLAKTVIRVRNIAPTEPIRAESKPRAQPSPSR